MSCALHHRLDGPSDAQAVVLSNSLGTSLRMWEPVASRLADSFRVISYDHRGQGDSPVPSGPYSIEKIGRDVLGLIDGLGIERVAFAGVSIGGMVGLWLAANAPDRIGALGLFCTSAHPGGPEAWRQRAAAVRRDNGTGSFAESVVDRWLTPAFAAAHPDIRRNLLTMLRASPPAGYAALADMLADLDLRPDLHRIRAPTLVVTAAQDQALPPEHGELIASRVPSTTNQIKLDPSAHIPMLERPEMVAALIRKHLEGAHA